MSVNSLGYLSGLTTDFTNVRAMGNFAVDGVLTVQDLSANSLIGMLSANTVNAESGNTIGLLAALSTNTLSPASGNTLHIAVGATLIHRSIDSGGGYHNVLASGAVGDGSAAPNVTAFSAADALPATKIVPPGTYAFGASVNLGGRYIFRNARLKPASGTTVTLGPTFRAQSLTSWQDTSAGGAFSASAGAYVDWVSDDTNGSTPNPIRGYAGNSISTGLTASVIAGGGTSGSPMLMIGNSGSGYLTISGGYDSVISSTGIGASTIAGGAHHRITGDANHSTIGGGSLNTVSAGAYGTIAGGTANQVHAQEGTIGGGTGHIVSGQGGTVAGGSTNSVSGSRGFVGAGVNNSVAGNDGVIGGGNDNDIANAVTAVIGGGASNKITPGTAAWGTGAFLGGGLSNQIGVTASSQYASILGGRGNSASGDYSAILGGRDSVTSATHSVAMGHEAVTSMIGQFAHAASKFAVAGDAQSSIIMARRQTTNNTGTEIRIGAGTARISIPTDTTWCFKLFIVARRTDADGESAAWEWFGCIDNNAGTTALVGTPSVTSVRDSTWETAVSADNTNDALAITATGENSKTINWVARIQLVEVTG